MKNKDTKLRQEIEAKQNGWEKEGWHLFYQGVGQCKWCGKTTKEIESVEKDKLAGNI